MIINLEKELSHDIQPAREKLKKIVGEEIVLHPKSNYLEAEIATGFEAILRNAKSSELCTTLVVPPGERYTGK